LTATVTPPPDPTDTDGDGCSDAEENGPNPAFGGDRDALSPWDFYDVPAPPLSPSFPNAARDQVVSLNDAAAVLQYFGTTAESPAEFNDNGLAYGSDWNENGVADGREYDRLPSADAMSPWRSGPPSGDVSLEDVAVGLFQFGHICSMGT
jgi:hypothetical protein